MPLRFLHMKKPLPGGSGFYERDYLVFLME